MVQSSLTHIWTHIRNELSYLQVLSSSPEQGQILNPISNSVYSQNTACAALVFAAEYTRNQDVQWFTKAKQAINSLKKLDVYAGLDEPKWTRLGWDNNKGSLFTTGTTIDALWKAQSLLGIGNDLEKLHCLENYLETCQIKSGGFAHDSIQPGAMPHIVQNITAIALYLSVVTGIKLGINSDILLAKNSHNTRILVNGQRHDGFWPYIYPGKIQQVAFLFWPLWPLINRLPVGRSFFFRPGDASVFFGDAVHHCLVLYYMSKTAVLCELGKDFLRAIAKGWQWTLKHLEPTAAGHLRFNFDWEPVPYGFRYCNFRDTSTYFLILASLPYLGELKVIGQDYHHISSGLLKHIESNLLSEEGTYPGIKPYEGPPSILKFILPRVGEAVAWKGALLAEFLLKQGSEQG